MRCLMVLLALVLTASGGSAMSLTLRGSGFQSAGLIPKKYTCSGADISPSLSWEGVPAAAKSLVLIMDDPDAPPGTWVHWVVYDIPATEQGLAEGIAKIEALPNGTRQGLGWGVNDFSRVGYSGPCPPPGPAHRYFFKLYALDKSLGLPVRATKPQVEQAMQGHILAEAQLIGRYGR